MSAALRLRTPEQRLSEGGETKMANARCMSGESLAADQERTLAVARRQEAQYMAPFSPSSSELIKVWERVIDESDGCHLLAGNSLDSTPSTYSN